ncbi:hypothetical protein LGH83_17350 [Lichenihabitans sp. PAMC28606]|uniref:hypothetical protein n=1 Tax=Lichenihabitans sp. PAMC28606 TaxID=2880932 RepID=UPI001D0A0F5C|nr:hypothetical protein [Lichenihabitans sp. PAMC28606]UDL94266.1 hypothetical protein LGH83_17350 [Lichenihabitans sp. PAMC28606]
MQIATKGKHLAFDAAKVASGPYSGVARLYAVAANVPPLHYPAEIARLKGILIAPVRSATS